MLVAGNVVIAGSLRLLPPLLPAIIDGFAVSVSEAGLAVTLMWVVYSLLQYPGGRLADALTRETVLVAGLGTLGGALLVILGADGFGTFVAGTLLLGAGAALYPPAAYAETAALFAEGRGERFGVLGASINLGGVAAAGLATVVLATGTWQVAFLPVVLVTGVVLVAIHVRAREPYQLGVVSLELRATLDRLLGEPRLRWFLVAVTLFTFVWQAVATMLPTFLELGKGFPQAVAGGAFAALFAVSIVVSPVAGWAGERYAYRRVALVFAALGAVGLAIVTAADSVAVVAVGVLAVAGGFGPFLAVVEAALVDRFPAASTGGDFGAGRALYVGLGSLGPGAVGVVVDAAGYATAFWGLLGVLGCSMAVLAAQVFARPCP